MKNRNLYIFAMKRSGQHAIINWLCKQNQPSLHYNACRFKSKPVPGKNKYEYKNNNIITYKHNNFDHNNYNLIIYNFEDKSPKNISDRYKDNSIVITRNIYNLVASRLQKGLKWNKGAWQDINNWKGYIIHFDSWFIDEGYRKQICKDLELNFTDDGLQDVFANGVSGFDGLNNDGNAQEMDVLNRWKKWENNSKYKEIIKGLE